jgi:L-malate glycosyltransferase
MPGRKCVLFLTHWAGNLGGAEYSLLDLIPETARRATVHLCASEDGKLVDLLKNNGVSTHVIPCTGRLLQFNRYQFLKSLSSFLLSFPGYLLYVFRVYRLTVRIQPDCIHANVPKSHITLFLLLLMGFRRKAVIHIREIFPRYSSAHLLYGLLFSFIPVRILAISQAVKNALPWYLQKKTTVIFNGVAVPHKNPHLPPTPPVRFLYFGRVVPWKGCHYLVEAFSELFRNVPPDTTRLTISGPTFYWDQQYRKKIVELIEYHHLEKVIDFNTGSDEPESVYRKHHVVCMMSDNEPFGRVAAEAQAYALPVIAFDSGGLSEIILHQKTGLLVGNRTLTSFTAAMRYFVDNKSRILAMGREGRKRVATHFNRTVQIPKIVEAILS